MFGEEVKDEGLTYFGIEQPSRHNVREPISRPVMTILTPRGRARHVLMTEAQLQALIIDAAKTLDAMRKCRNATVPAAPPLPQETTMGAEGENE